MSELTVKCSKTEWSGCLRLSLNRSRVEEPLMLATLLFIKNVVKRDWQTLAFRELRPRLDTLMHSFDRAGPLWSIFNTL